MGKRLNKRELEKENREIRKEIYLLEFKRRSLNTIRQVSYMYVHKNSRFYFSEYCAWLDTVEEKEIGKSKNPTPGKMIKELYDCQWKYTPEAEKLKEKMQKIYSKINKMLLEMTNKRNELNNRLNKNEAKIVSLRARKVARRKELSLQEKILEGSEERFDSYRYCTNTGREIKPNFNMIKPTKNRWAPDVVKPETFLDIGIAKMGGLVFHSEYQKTINAKEKVWDNKEERFLSTSTRKGLIYLAQNPNASDELKEKAKDYLKRIGDNLSFEYVDKKYSNSGSAKTKNIFIIKTEELNFVNKKEYRMKKKETSK